MLITTRLMAKRAFSPSDSLKDAPQKKRLFSIFNRDPTDPSTSFVWKKNTPHFLTNTCLYGENRQPTGFTSKVAAFDLDGTLIQKEKHDQWRFWHKSVPSVLKDVHDSGYTVVIISNQCLRDKELQKWKEKIPNIANSLKDVPFRILAATAKDMYRKPMPGMWVALEHMAKEAGVSIDRQNSYFVGDAAGRKGDWASTDRKFADNLDLKFFTPEEYFLKHKPEPYELRGKHINEYLDSQASLPRVTPTSTPILPLPSTPTQLQTRQQQQEQEQQELILFVGSPGSGKSTFYESTFRSAGYVHVNQDTLGSRAKCVKVVEEVLRGGGRCVVDNTNRDKATRKFYVDVARRFGVPVRCFVFPMPIELAWHNNLFRAFCRPLLKQIVGDGADVGAAKGEGKGAGEGEGEGKGESEGEGKGEGEGEGLSKGATSNTVIPSEETQSQSLEAKGKGKQKQKTDLKSETKFIPYAAFSSFADDYEEPLMSGLVNNKKSPAEKEGSSVVKGSAKAKGSKGPKKAKGVKEGEEEEEEGEEGEGFSEVRTVRFVFEGTELEERFYRMWLQIDRK